MLFRSALARTRADAHHVETHQQTIRFTEDGRRWSYETPWQVAQYVVDFDAGDEIKPFAFRLDPSRCVEIQRRVRTPEGKRAHDAAQRQRRAGKTVRKRKAAAAGKHSTMKGGEGARTKAPPRAYKTSKRNYGHRVMRINQAREDVT